MYFNGESVQATVCVITNPPYLFSYMYILSFLYTCIYVYIYSHMYILTLKYMKIFWVKMRGYGEEETTIKMFTEGL